MVAGLQRTHSREVGRAGLPRHVGVPARVNGDAVPDVRIAATQEGRIHQCRAGRIQLGQEGVSIAAPVGALQERAAGREVPGGRVSRDIGISSPVDGNAVADVCAGAAKVRRVHE